MATATVPHADPLLATHAHAAPGDRSLSVRTGDHGSAVSWSAVFAGAAGAAALSLILLVLGVGLGLSSVSPWTSQGASSATIGVGAIVWILFVAFVASGTGGYLAGRLRTRWVEAHTDEVYFRDTAHGFLAWAIATLVTAGVLTSTIGAIVGTGVQAGDAALGAAGTSATTLAAGGAGAMASQVKSDVGASSIGYVTDSVFRPMTAAPGASAAAAAPIATESTTSATAAEVGRIFTRSLSIGAMSADDTRYVGQLVAQRTGMSPQDADKRVSDAFAKMQQSVEEARVAADKARKAAAYSALWLFVSLLFGAFISSFMATFGGRQRDF